MASPAAARVPCPRFRARGVLDVSSRSRGPRLPAHPVARGHARALRSHARRRLRAGTESCVGEVYRVSHAPTSHVAGGVTLSTTVRCWLGRARAELRELSHRPAPRLAHGCLHALSRHGAMEGRAGVRSREDGLSTHRQAPRRRVRKVPSGRATPSPDGFRRAADAGVPPGPLQGLLQLSREPARGQPDGIVLEVPRDVELQDDRPCGIRPRSNAVSAAWSPRGRIVRVVSRHLDAKRRPPRVRHVCVVPSRPA